MINLIFLGDFLTVSNVGTGESAACKASYFILIMKTTASFMSTTNTNGDVEIAVIKHLTIIPFSLIQIPNRL
jgi:hypothetical protein